LELLELLELLLELRERAIVVKVMEQNG